MTTDRMGTPRREALALGICGEVLERITPRPEERNRVQSLVDRLVTEAEAHCRATSLQAKVEVFGSVAKDTWLSGEADIDLFIILQPSTPREVIAGEALQVGKRVVEKFHGSWIERYAEHPYVEGCVEGIRVNLVPCYDVMEGDWFTAVDRTPLHTKYVKSRLSDEAKGEVRLLKRFMKGVGIYGAEIKVTGFSGYLCELLLIHYTRFLKVLKAAAKWRHQIVLTVEPMEKINKERAGMAFTEPLVVVDPVDHKRNVASAVSLQRMSELVAASRAFLEQPSMAFFYPPEPVSTDPEELAKALSTRGTDIIVLTFGRVDAVPDVLWGQIYRSLKAITSLLKEHDFNVLRASAWSDEKNSNIITFELEQSRLPVAKLQVGPPVTADEVRNFIHRHSASPRTISGPWVDEERWVVVTRRREVKATAILEKMLAQRAAEIGIRDRIVDAFRRGYKLCEGIEIAGVCKSNPEFAAFFNRFLTGIPSWLEVTGPSWKDRVPR